MGKIHYNQADQALIQHSRHVKLLDAEKKSWKRGVSSRSLCKVTRLLYRSYDSYECSFTFLRYVKREEKYGCHKLSDVQLDYVLAKTLGGGWFIRSFFASRFLLSRPSC